MKRAVWWLAVAAAVALGGMAAVPGGRRTAKVAANWVRGRVAPRTSEEVAARLEREHPEWRARAESAGGSLRLFVFKREGRLEVHAPGWAEPLSFPTTARSGGPGPKLREGDRQIPEGMYRVESLNPNSLYHLALRLDYPNAFDRARAKEDGRERLGGDIMIHGSDASVGCVAVGDAAIEEIFYLAAILGLNHVDVVLAPYDMRQGRHPDWEMAPLPWYGTLCNSVAEALGTE